MNTFNCTTSRDVETYKREIKSAPPMCWLECKLVQLLQKIIWQHLLKLIKCLPYGPAIAPLGIFWRGMGTNIHQAMH